MEKIEGKSPWLGGVLGIMATVALVICLGNFSGAEALAEAAWSPILTAPQTTEAVSAEVPQQLVAMGRTVGIKLFSDGVLVVGQGSVETTEGRTEPGKTAGVKAGDIITHLDGQEVNTIEEIQVFLAENGEDAVDLSVQRGESQLTLTVEPAETPQGSYQMGLWLRDSMAGIGTITYCDPTTGQFVALGHGVNDVDTAMLMPLEYGSIMYAEVAEVKAGTAGVPGELHGEFDLTQDLGELTANTETGLYGVVTQEEMLEWGTLLDVASSDEIVEGAAIIRANVTGDQVEEFQIEITEIYGESAGNTKNMMIEVTDQRLLELTGGIVQGMSGSPILQNGKLIGAVTHVLVNDPAKGYGIFIENMLETGISVTEENIAS